MPEDQNRLCVIHNNVCEASFKLEVVEQRIIAYLVSLIEREDEDFKDYRVVVKDLANVIGIKRKDFYSEVSKVTKKLTCKGLSLKRLDGRRGELQVSWLSAADYLEGEGTVILRFDKGLKPYLLQLKEYFTQFPLVDVIKFRSQFSMPIYLLLKQYLKIGYRKMSIDDIRKSLNLIDQYAQYGVFKLKVINTAVKEINEKTSLDVEFIEIKQGRKVVAINFTIKVKESEIKQIETVETSSEQFEAQQETNKTADNEELKEDKELNEDEIYRRVYQEYCTMHNIIKEDGIYCLSIYDSNQIELLCDIERYKLQLKELEEKNLCLKELEKIGIDNTVLEEYGIKKVRYQLENLKDYKASGGKIKTTEAAWLISAIKNNWPNNFLEKKIEKEQEETALKEEMEAIRKKQEEMLREEESKDKDESYKDGAFYKMLMAKKQREREGVKNG